MPQFEQVDTFISQIFWLVVCFGLLHLFVSRVFVPRIGAIQSRRHAHIQGCIVRSRKLLDRVTQLENNAAEDLRVAHERIAVETEAALAEFTALKQKRMDEVLAELDAQWHEFQDKLQAQIKNEQAALDAVTDKLVDAVCDKMMLSPQKSRK